MGEILRPPRLTGDASADLGGVVEFLWALYRAIVLELDYVRTQDVTDGGTTFDPQLSAIAALTPTDTNNLPYFTSENEAALAVLSAYMRTMLASGSAATARGTLGLGALAILDTVGAAVLAANTVTYAKIQQVPQDRILGRQTASTGNIEEITCGSAGRALIAGASAAAQRTTLGLVIGTNVQAYDDDLAAIAGLTSAADKLPYFTGTGMAALADFTAAGRTLSGGATAAAQRESLGIKHQRVTTGSISAGSTSLVTLTWASPYADANYTPQASVLDSTATSLSLSVVHVESWDANGVSVRIINNALGAITGTLLVTAIHD